MNFLERCDPREFYFYVSHENVGGPFGKTTLRELIRGSLSLPVHQIQAASRRKRVELDLTGVVQNCDIRGLHTNNLHRHVARLRQFFHLVFGAAMGGLDLDEVLHIIMDGSVRRHSDHGWTRWDSVLEDFAFWTHLLSDDVLRGQRHLRNGLPFWLLQNCSRFANETSLPLSLQFVDLCENHAAFDEAMWQLMAHLPQREMQALFYYQGNINLLFSHLPSERVRSFVRRLRHQVYPTFQPYNQPTYAGPSRWRHA